MKQIWGRILREPREFILKIVKEIDNDEWSVSDNFSFGPFLASPDEKLFISQTCSTFLMIEYMQMYYCIPGENYQYIKLYHKEHQLIWNAAHSALYRLRKRLKNQLNDYIESYVEDFDETRI
ncbi:hypothetical protein [Caulobacter phage Cr30]|uniref:hypothetical protein n=1 Tax=Caulobacter phage Cr30 TaxID=1357714 RepID=UPI0004A9B9C6|nr:hypothetical protein OZ74_gp003 [Caulobacter phage Cr30]AGS80888.1 hypothetical protein [Caulobacter phage Cr30]